MVFQGLFYAFAEDTEGSGATEDYACVQYISEQSFPVLQNYEDFLNEYFQIDKPTSSQTEKAMDYYRYVEDTLNAIYNDSLKAARGLFSKEDNTTLDQSNAEVTYCSSIRDQYLRAAQVLLERQVLSSASSKRTFKMVDGLKIMNEDLGDFSQEFLETFPGIFNQMNNALPCYARQCITQ